jgi:hypothetical protein
MRTDKNYAAWLLQLAQQHIAQFQVTNDIKLLKIANQLQNEAALWEKSINFAKD